MVDPALEESIRRSPPGAEIEAVALLRRGRPPPPDLRVVATFGRVVTGRIRTDRIRAVRADPAVFSLKAARIVEPAAALVGDGAAGEDVAATAPRGVPGATGRGTLLAFLDWRCDFAHPSFRRADGGTRLRALWDQHGPPEAGTDAVRYGYGRVLTRERIDAALREPDPYAALGYHPGRRKGGAAHGTHVMDIAAGNGRAPGSIAGVAPDADLLFVDLAAGHEGLEDLGNSVRILEALDFVRGVAGDTPWVANLSLGRTCGDHTGRSAVERAIDAVLEEAPGRAVSQSCGNYFDKELHAEGRVRPGADATLGWRVRADDPTPNELEVWYSGRDRLGLVITPPGGAPAVEVPLGQQRALYAQGRLAGIGYHRARDPLTRAHHVDVFLEPDAPAGTWLIRLVGLDVVDGRFHAWIERDTLAGQSRFEPDQASPRATIGSIATGRRALVVGAYDPRTDALGGFSSSGPTRDGRQKPDLVAPGVGIVAARSTPLGAPPGSGGLVAMSGTSMASPHVAGAVALLFEAAPRRLRIAETRLLLLGTAGPIAGDPLRIGNGALNVAAALDAARLMADERSEHMASGDDRSTGEWPAPGTEAFERRMASALGPAHGYEVIGRPGAPLDAPLRAGDILVRVGNGDGEPTRVRRVADAELRAADDGGDAESAGDGWYAGAGELTAEGWSEAAPVRVVDHRGQVPPQQLVLRGRGPFAPAGAWAPPAAPAWQPPVAVAPPPAAAPPATFPGLPYPYAPQPFGGYAPPPGAPDLSTGFVPSFAYGVAAVAPYAPEPYAAYAPEPEPPPPEPAPSDGYGAPAWPSDGVAFETLEAPLSEQAAPTFTPRSWALPAPEWADVPFYVEWIAPDTLEYRIQPVTSLKTLGLDQRLFEPPGPATRVIDLHEKLGLLREKPGAAGQLQVGLKTKVYYPGVAGSSTDVAPGGPFPVVLILPGNHQAVETKGSASPLPAPWKHIVGPAWAHEIPSHEGYHYLQEDLAAHGVISFAISTNPANALNGFTQMRADLVLEYVELLRKIQGGRIRSPLSGQLDLARIGLLGHSRGGDGVVKAALDNQAQNAGPTPPGTPVQIKAVCALAPTDFVGTARPADRPKLRGPLERLLVVYGSHDGDISGRGGGLDQTGTGFRHYDRSLLDWSTMIFVRSVAHNRFNTVWDNSSSPPGPSGQPFFKHGDPFHRLVKQPDGVPSDPTCAVASPPGPPDCPAPTDYRSIADHQALAKEYIGGFFRWALSGEPLEDRFKGASFPLGAGSGVTRDDVAIQYLVKERRIIDGFEVEPPGRNALGGPATYTSAQVIEFVEGKRPEGTDVIAIAPRVPHQTHVLDARPDVSPRVVYRTELRGPASQDFRAFSHLTFRITGGFDVRRADTIEPTFPRWRLRLGSGEGTKIRWDEVDQAAIDTSGVRAPKRPFFHQIWEPGTGPGQVVNVTKLHFQTVAIPLTAFGGADLAHVRLIELVLPPGLMPVYVDTLCLMKL